MNFLSQSRKKALRRQRALGWLKDFLATFCEGHNALSAVDLLQATKRWPAADEFRGNTMTHFATKREFGHGEHAHPHVWSNGCGDAFRADPPLRDRIKLACGEAVSVNPAITSEGAVPILEDSSGEESKGLEKQYEEDDRFELFKQIQEQGFTRKVKSGENETGQGSGEPVRFCVAGADGSKA
eukprot:2398209-Karenia_brevis.AAC.1